MARPVQVVTISKDNPLTPELALAVVIREKRLAKGLKQADMEGDEGMDRSYISKLELGQRQINLRGVLHIAEKLGVLPGDLLNEVYKLLSEHEKK